MIRYPGVTEQNLVTLIEAEKPGWLARADNRTERFRDAGKYNEASGIWSEVKAVYMTIQHNKCAFCEQELENSRIVHDVEHYRPKSSARGWPPDDETRQKRGLPASIPAGSDLPEGYYLLAYHPLNYVTACKHCNTTLKNDFFPIAGQRVSKKDHPADHHTEEPYIPYPIGDFDVDPEDLFTFNGIFPIPVNRRGKKHRRASVTIAFFDLATRETLLRQRARSITNLARAYRDSIDGRSERVRSRGKNDVERLTGLGAPHSNCLRAFHRICESDPDAANIILDQVYDFLDRIDEADAE